MCFKALLLLVTISTHEQPKTLSCGQQCNPRYHISKVEILGIVGVHAGLAVLLIDFTPFHKSSTTALPLQ